MTFRSLMKKAARTLPPIRRIMDQRYAATVRAESEAARADTAVVALQKLKVKNAALKMALASFDVGHEALSDMNADAWTALGNQRLYKGGAADATRAYEKALALESGRRDAAFGLGMAMYDDGRQEEAMNLFRDLIATDSDNLRYYFSYLGAMLHSNGRRNAAVAAWAVEMETQVRLAEEAGIPKTTRYLPGNCTQTIGSMALIDSWAKRQLLGLSPAERYVIQAPRGYIANTAYLDCWKKYFDVVNGEEADLRKLSHLLDDNLTVLFLNGRWLWFHDAACELEELWEASGRGALVQLSEEDVARGRTAMEAMGLPRDAWFVAIHVRDSGHDNDDDIFNSRRNADISDYLPAISKVTDAGGWVVRLGDSSAARIPDMLRLIDYAHAERRDWLDIFLLSAAKFLIGTNSGPLWVAGTFGVPALFTNSAPMGIQSHFSNSVTLPQLLWSNAEGRKLTFAEQMAEPFAWTDSARLLGDLGYASIKNTPEEIAAGVDEMLARSNQTWSEGAADAERQQRFRAALAKAGISSRNRIGSQFLKDHAELLG